MEQHDEYGTGDQPEQPDRFGGTETPGYWSSVGFAAVIFGFVNAVLMITSGYMTINSEPTGSIVSSQMVMGGIGCLITAFGGMLAIWHYHRETGVTMKIGRGALIGLYTGIAIALIATLLSHIWYMIDPAFNDQLMESMIANYEAMDMDAEMKQGLIDGTYSEFQNARTAGGILKGLLISSAIIGFLNMLTGMLGVALFAREKDEI